MTPGARPGLCWEGGRERHRSSLAEPRTLLPFPAPQHGGTPWRGTPQSLCAPQLPGKLLGRGHAEWAARPRRPWPRLVPRQGPREGCSRRGAAAGPPSRSAVRTRGCWHPARGLRASPAAAASPGWLGGLPGSGRHGGTRGGKEERSRGAKRVPPCGTRQDPDLTARRFLGSCPPCSWREGSRAWRCLPNRPARSRAPGAAGSPAPGAGCVLETSPKHSPCGRLVCGGARQHMEQQQHLDRQTGRKRQRWGGEGQVFGSRASPPPGSSRCWGSTALPAPRGLAAGSTRTKAEHSV